MPLKIKDNLKNKIVDYIFEAILNNEFKSKDQIKETHLANKLQVSRAPIREAFSQLVSLGILEQIEKRGVFVKEINKQDIIDTYEAKGIIEGFLARSFIKEASKKDYDLLNTYIINMSKKTNSEKDIARIGTLFHKHYLKYAKNLLLLNELEKLNKKSYLLFSKNLSKLYSREEIKQRHQLIADALISKNTQDIENTIKEHYFHTGNKIILLR